MGPDPDLSADILEFILTRIDSVPHLEALLLFWAYPVQRWTEASLMESLYIPAHAARDLLRDLLRRGFIAPSDAAGTTFMYDPTWDPKGDFMHRLESEYRRRLVRIANLIHSKASPGVRNFADAFDFKKE